MAKTIALSIEIDGLSDLTKQVVGLEQQLESLNAELKETEKGSDEYIKLRNAVAVTKEELSKAKKEQKDFVKSAEATKQAEGSYYQLNQQLVDLRKAYKNLSAAERESAKGKEMQMKIQELDTELKKIDGNIGQFQRNVGNYPKTFALINRSLMRTIPGFEAFSEQLKDGEGRLTGFGKALIGGFIAFQGAKFIAGAIKSLDDFNKKIQETRNTVAEFSNAYGEDLDNLTASTTALAETFDTDAESISRSAKNLSKTMGISFEEAITQIEGALVEGKGNATEYLKKIEEFPNTFVKASGSMSELAKKNQGLLDSNKELAKSQVNIAKETQKLSEGFKSITNTVKTTFLTVLIRLIDVFKPLWTAVYELGKALFDLTKSFFAVFTGGKETVNLMDVFVGVLNLVITPVKIIINILTELTKIWKNFAPIIVVATAAIVGYRVAIVAATVATNAQKIALVAYNVALKLFTAFTNGAKLATQAFNAVMKASPIGLIIGAATAAAGALYAMSEATDDESKKLEELAEKEREAAEAAQRRTDAYKDRIAAIEDAYQKEKAALDLRNAEGIISEEEYSEQSIKINTDRINKLLELNNKQLADNQRRAAANEKITEGENEAIKASNQQLQIELNQLRAEQAKIDKKRRDDAIKAAQKLAEERKKYGEEEIKQERARVALLADLNVRLQEELVKNIKDNRERELKEVDLNTQAQIAQLKKQYDDLKLAAEEREKELLERFGKTSAELVKTQQENAKQLEIIRAKQAEIEVQIEQNAVNKKKEINDSYRQEELDKTEENIQKLKELRDSQMFTELDYIQQVADMRELQNEETLNKLLIQEKDAKKREALVRIAEEKKLLDEIEKIKVQQRAVDDQEAFLKDQASKGVAIRQEEFDAVNKARQELNTKLSKAELDYKDMVTKNTGDIKADWLKNLEDIMNYVQMGIEAVDIVFSAINDRAEKQVEDQMKRSSERQDELNDELQGATGLHRLYLQQQLETEIENEKKLAKEQERIQRNAAIKEKAIAAAQSIIQGFLAVSKAVASAPFPVNVPAIIQATAMSTLQTAGILAQPLADGGAVTPVSLPDSGGKVIAAQNIPQTNKGDNVLVAARVGETFLNARQTKILRPALSAARIPGFANGGLLGAPSTGGIGSNNTLRAFNDRTVAISDQVLESKVYLVTDELQRDTQEGERIKKKVTLR